MTGTLLSLEDVGAGYAGRAVLTGISFEIAPGEILTVVGPNGAGKTTLARIVTGVAEPESGRVVRRPGLRTGYVPQRLNTDPLVPMSTHRLIALTAPHPRDRALKALEAVGAADLIDRQVHDLSGGELQRVLIARALLAEPDLLVLDEPMRGVDTAGQAEFYRLLGSLSEQNGTAVLMISHDLHVVMAASHTVICLNRHICCHGAPETVSAHPEYRALFGREDADALALYRHDHDHVHGLAGEETARRS